jgi:hypothetical protein
MFKNMATIALIAATHASVAGQVRTAPKAGVSRAAQECRTLIEGFDGKSQEEIVLGPTSEQLFDLRQKLENCVTDHADELTKRHVVIAFKVSAWVADQ